MSQKDPFELLKKDHQEVEQLFLKLEDTTERAEKTREELFTELKDALDLHAEIEESILYPAMEEADLTHTMALEAEAEHEQVKTLLTELESMDQTSEEWTAKLKVLMENVRHHVKEEEGEMFPNTKKAFSEEELAAMAQEMEKAKAEAK